MADDREEIIRERRREQAAKATLAERRLADYEEVMRSLSPEQRYRLLIQDNPPPPPPPENPPQNNP